MDTLDVRGRSCPIPILMLQRRVAAMRDGDTLRVLADDADFPNDVRSWCERQGHTLESIERVDDYYVVQLVRVRREPGR